MSITQWYFGANAAFFNTQSDQEELKNRFLHHDITYVDAKIIHEYYIDKSGVGNETIENYKHACSTNGTTIMFDGDTLESILRKNVHFIKKDVGRIFEEFKDAVQK